MIKFLKQNNIRPIAYCPIARGADTSKCPNILTHETILKQMAKYEKTGAQILLNWGVQRGHIVIPKSNSLERLKENIDSLNFILEEADVEEISKIDEGHRICDIPSFI